MLAHYFRSLFLCLLFFVLPCRNSAAKQVQTIFKGASLTSLKDTGQPVSLETDLFCDTHNVTGKPTTIDGELLLNPASPGLWLYYARLDNFSPRQITIPSACKKLLFPFHGFW